MKKPTLTQSFLSMQRMLTLASIFLFSFQLQAQIINYHCDCNMDPVYLTGTIDIESGPGENWQICDVTNFFANKGDVTPFADGKSVVETTPGSYTLSGFVMDGPAPTLRLKRIEADGVTLSYDVEMYMGTCPRTRYSFDRCADPDNCGPETLCLSAAPITLCLDHDQAVAAPEDFIWTADPAGGVWFSNQGGKCVDIVFSEAGTYTITTYGTDTRNGCGFEESYVFEVIDYQPTVSGDQLFCDLNAAGPHTYTLSTGNTDDTGLAWSCPTCTSVTPDASLYSADVVLPNLSASPTPESHTLTVTGISPDGCNFSIDYVIEVVDQYEATIEVSDSYVCVNDEAFYALGSFTSGSTATWSISADAGNADPVYLPASTAGGNQGEINFDFSGAVGGDQFYLFATGTFADSGCGFTSNVVSIEVGTDQSGSIACNNQVNLTMDLSCEVQFLPNMILQGFDINNDSYIMTLTNVATSQVLAGNMLNSSHIGMTFQVMVFQECGDNSCWGFVTIEDKTIPSLAPFCDDKDFYALCTDLAMPGNTVGFPTFHTDPSITVTYQGNSQWLLEGFDNCGLATLTYEDESDVDFCEDAVIVTRTWTATDQISGATSTCEIDINVLPSTAHDILWPSHWDDIFADADYPTLDPCDSTIPKNADGTPNPSYTGSPIIPACGANFRDPSYSDVIIPVCGEAPYQSMKILRTWSVYDECENEFVEYTQIITLMDTEGPVCISPVEGEVYVNIHECKIDRIDFPIPDYSSINDAEDCSGVNLQIGYKLRDADTGIIPSTFTYLPVGVTSVTDVPADSDSIWVNYLAWDDCGNFSPSSTGNPADRGCFTELAILDITQPTPVCDSYSVVALNEDGCAYAKPQTFDDGSNDNCGLYQNVIRRMDHEDNPCGCEGFRPQFDFMDYLGEYVAADGSTHHYYLSDHLANGPRAFAYAAALGAYPIMVGSAAENAWINTQVRNITNDPYFIGLFAAYPGTTTLSSDFDWANGSTNPYRNWVGGSYPNPTPAPGPDYYVQADVNGEWSPVRQDKNVTLGRYIIEVEDPCGWTQELKFCCADLEAGSVMVQMRAIDNYGNHNFCMVEVAIEDNTPPSISAPANLSRHCEDNFTNLNIFGNVTVLNADEECSLDTMYSETPLDLDECGNGTIIRTWVVTDAAGNSRSVSQTITVSNTDLFDGDTDVNWPDHITLSDGRCDIEDIDPASLPSASGEPRITRGDHCANVTSAFDDLVYYSVDDACMKVVRTWTVIDWCQNGRSWNYDQVIKLTDDQSPLIAGENCGSGVVIDGQASGPNCTIDGQVIATASDNCTDADDLDWTFTLTPDGGAPVAGAGNVLNGPFPLGTHTIEWTVVDHCGNVATCVQRFTVDDTKPPIAYCRDLVVTSLDETDETAVIWAEDLVVPTTDYCDGNVSYSFSPDVNDISREYACRHIENGEVDTVFVDVYFTDQQGNSTVCNVGIILQDNNDVCPDAFTIGSKAMIAGNVFTERSEKIEDVDVTIFSTAPEFPLNEMTLDGEYAFEDVDMHNNYTLQAEKDIEYLNGVSTLDLVLIQKHILGVQLLDSPYKIIAADVNGSDDVSSIDLIELRKLILGIYNELPNNDSWRFVEEDFIFNDVQNPWPYDEVILLNNITDDKMDADFVGVKIGDVNNTVTLELTNGGSAVQTRSNGTFNIAIEESNDLGGDTKLNFIAGSTKELIGTQFTLKFNQENIEIKDFVSEAWDVNQGNVNMAKLDEGILALSWNSSRTLSINEGDILFSIDVKYLNDNKGSFTQINAPVVAEAYEEVNGQINILDLRFDDNKVVATGFEVFQNVPNPFTKQTTIGFKVGSTEEILLQVSDYTGRVIYAESRISDQGYHEFVLGKEVLNTAGMLFYQISTETQTITKKMVILE